MWYNCITNVEERFMDFLFIAKTTKVKATTQNLHEECIEYASVEESQEAATRLLKELLSAISNSHRKHEFTFLGVVSFSIILKNAPQEIKRFSVLPTKTAEHFDLTDIYQHRGYNNSTPVWEDIIVPTPKLIEHIKDLIEMRYPEHAEHDFEILDHAMKNNNIFLHTAS